MTDYTEVIHLKPSTPINKWPVKVVNPDWTDINSILEDTNFLIRRMAKIMESLAVTDVNKRQRIVVDNIGSWVNGMDSWPWVPTVNRPTSFAPISSPWWTTWTPVWIWPVDQRYVIKDAARLSYNNWIRSHLSFT
jgi:hypothetical protein